MPKNGIKKIVTFKKDVLVWDGGKTCFIISLRDEPENRYITCKDIKALTETIFEELMEVDDFEAMDIS